MTNMISWPELYLCTPAPSCFAESPVVKGTARNQVKASTSSGVESFGVVLGCGAGFDVPSAKLNKAELILACYVSCSSLRAMRAF